MVNHHHAASYVADFKELASQTKWNPIALCAQFLWGLAPRLKDILAASPTPTPSGYDELVDPVQDIDQCYWERKEEDAPESKSRNSTQACSALSTNSTPTPTSSTSSAPSSRALSELPHCDKRSATPQVDLTGMLSPDGRLTVEEKQPHRDFNLCTLCASLDHCRDACPKAPPPSSLSAGCAVANSMA
jgi:hypothetical protein